MATNPAATSPASDAVCEVRIDKPAGVFSPSGLNRVPASRAVAVAMAQPLAVQPVAASYPTVVAAPTPVKNRVQRIREMEANVYVKRCMEMFDGEIIRIDMPPKEGSSGASPLVEVQDDEFA